MPWITALLSVLASVTLLAGLGLARTYKPRPSLRELEHLHLGWRPEVCDQRSRVSPDAQKAAAHPSASGPVRRLPAARRDGLSGGGRLRVIARFLGRLLLLLTGAQLLMVDPSETNLPPIAATDSMPAPHSMTTKVQSDRLVAMDENKTDAKDVGHDTPEVEPEQAEADVEASKPLPMTPTGMFFDGLQFYKILTDVGKSAVQSAVDAAVARALRSVATKRPLPPTPRPDSIAFIRERYPDFICLLPTATHPAKASGSGPSRVLARRPHSDSFPPRMDLLSALMLSSAASGAPSAHCPLVKAVGEDAGREGSEQVRRAAALASPRPSRDGSFLRVA